MGSIFRFIRWPPPVSPLRRWRSHRIWLMKAVLGLRRTISEKWELSTKLTLTCARYLNLLTASCRAAEKFCWRRGCISFKGGLKVHWTASRLTCPQSFMLRQWHILTRIAEIAKKFEKYWCKCLYSWFFSHFKSQTFALSWIFMFYQSTTYQIQIEVLD